jgi:D-sedoheptulose 7-phosphate isomerase
MTFPSQYRDRLLHAIDSIDVEKVGQVIQLLAHARDHGRRIFAFGNGGSACTASHFAMEMLKGASYGRPARFRILALNESAPTITAYTNDVDYECIFAEQLKNFAEPGDILMAISSSGNSPNVLRAVEYGNSIGCRTIALTGYQGGKLGPLAELEIRTAENHTGRVEDTHMVVMHMICYYFMEEERTHTHP